MIQFCLQDSVMQILRQKDDKLIPAQTTDQITASKLCFQTICKQTENMISLRMAKMIVDGFKMVQIQQQHDSFFFPVQKLFCFRFETASAQKFGQIVPMMLFLLIFQRECQLLFSRLFSRLINDDPDQIIIHLIRMNGKIFSLIQYDAVFFSRCGQLFQKGTKLLRMR